MPGAVAQGGKKATSKNAYRRAQKKAKRQETPTPSEAPESARADNSEPPESDDDGVSTTSSAAFSADDINPEYDLDNPFFKEYRDVFLKFQPPSEEEAAEQDDKPYVFRGEDDGVQDEEEEEETVNKLSRKARKAANTMSVAELKAKVKKPEMVEWTDVSSTDPLLLLEIKAAKNVIPVPNHWSLKREYLSSKRGIEKPAFSLPKFIQETGISEMRDALLEKQADMSLKQRQRERVQGKTGKMDIDYHKLYDAFFRRQTKPEMTHYGEVYYEGKEYETNLKHLRPGELSDELKDALGMVPGGPPPWLINQQRFGVPPSYPHLKVPGVNSPLPPGASWGYSAGQWGKPPQDENGRPLFGDVHGFTELQQQPLQLHPGEPVERAIWGALRADGESDEESEEEEDEDEEDEDEASEDISGIQTSASVAPSEIGGTESIAGDFTLRKHRKGIETEDPRADPRAGPRSAYQVLPERDIEATGFFGGEHAYDLGAARRDHFTTADSRRKRKAGEVEVSVDVDALAANDTLDKDALRKQYDAQQKAESQGQWQSIDQDDLSEMIASEGRKRQKREEERRTRR